MEQNRVRTGFEGMMTRRAVSRATDGSDAGEARPWIRIAAGALAISLVAAACGAGEAAVEPGGDGPTGSSGSATDATQSFEEPAVDEATAEFLALSLDDKIVDFLAAPSSSKGALVAEAMGDSGDPRFGAWLLDLYRLGRSTRIDGAAAEAFARLSGIETVGQRTDDYRNYGNWVYNAGIDPGDGYREWKLGVYGTIDPEFAELLAATTDDVVLSQIQWGGVTRGGIPELNQPARIPAAAADWMTDDELVLGVVIDGQAVAYPIRILGHHELANDEIAGVPVSMVYCTLCLSGLLFDRRVGDQVLDFQTSGLLIESNKIMVDNQTDTLWRHQTGRGLAGPLAGAELVQFPVLTTTWGEWIDEHPTSEVLDIPEPTYPDASVSPEQPAIAYPYEAGGAYRFYYEDPDVWFPVFDTPEVFDLKEPVLGMSDGTTDLAVRVDALVAAGPQVFVVGDTTMAAIPTSSGALVYDVTGSELLAGPLTDIAESDSERLRLGDGTTWDRIAVSQLFWFAWFGQHPSTDWWPR